MAYTPTEWVSGTIISASKLNNIERGVESVNSEYTPTTWAEGDTVTAAKLNKIEQGIADASGGGSDFSTTSVDIVNDTGTPQLEVRVPCIVNGEIRDFAYIDIDGGTLSVVMYKGKCEMWGGAYDVSAVSGSAVLDDGIAYISGNATVTFSD